MAIIAEFFHPHERGKAMGIWNSVAPIFGMIGPVLAGFLTDHFNWRVIFVPILLSGDAAVYIVWKQLPALPGQADPHFLRRFDWGGAILLSLATILLVFYISSRPITGIPGLQDWRLLAGTLLCWGGFIYWEKRQTRPFIDLNLFANKTFNRAALYSAVWMFVVPGGVDFVFALYLADVYHASRSFIGLILMAHAAAFLVSTPIGGQTADKLGLHWPMLVGATGQLSLLLFFIWLPESSPIWLIFAGVMAHGLSAGFSMAAQQSAALHGIAPEQVGMAAAVYSLIRFSGSVFGLALIGVMLQQTLAYTATPIGAYQIIYGILAGIVLLELWLGWQLRG